MSELNDQWIESHSPIDAKKLHALGVVNFHWNTADIGLKLLHVVLDGQTVREGWASVHDQRDKTLCRNIEKIVSAGAYEQTEREAVLHGIELYDICRENRNQLSHFLPSGFVGTDLARLKGADFDPQPFPDSLDDVRRVATDIAALLDYLSGLLNHFVAKNLYRWNPTEPPPLPDRLPLPTRLWSKPIPPTR